MSSNTLLHPVNLRVHRFAAFYPTPEEQLKAGQYLATRWALVASAPPYCECACHKAIEARGGLGDCIHCRVF